MTEAKTISVLCVDDNEHVAHALRLMLNLAGGFTWKGWIPDANELVTTSQQLAPDIVLLDIDMPGKDPFTALSELSEQGSEPRVIVFSGHVRKELIDRAIEAGAWAYVSKNDGEDSLVEAIHHVVAGDFTLSPEARTAFQRF